MYYIGATDHDLDYDWQWETDHHVVYPEMFGPHQPDRYQGHAQECLAINVNDGWRKSLSFLSLPILRLKMVGTT